jgi:hypothetical protein
MKNYKTLVAALAVGMALVATERPAEATLSYLTQGTGDQPVLRVLSTVTQQQADWLYSYTFTVGDLSDSIFTATTGTPVTSFSVVASFVNVASIASAPNTAVASGYENGAATWIFFPGVNSDTVSFTSDYGPTLGTASAQDDGLAWSTANVGGSPVPVPTPVPEASTVMAGALMLLPFGIGAIRSLRKERAV